MLAKMSSKANTSEKIKSFQAREWSEKSELIIQ